MLNPRSPCIVAIPVLLSACASGPPFIDQMQPTAIDMAMRRGTFAMNCPDNGGKSCFAGASRMDSMQ
jgi:hypothetical protein